MSQAVFIAFGTRGDVQPVALVAKLCALRGSTVRFVTHAEHLGWLNEIFGDISNTLEVGLENGAVVLVPIATPAIVSTSGATSKARCASSSAELWSRAQQNACLAACLGGNPSANIKFENPVTLVAFNLFALEGLVIADVVGLPCVALHPYPLPTHWQPAGKITSDMHNLSANDSASSCTTSSNRFPFPGGLQALQTRLREEWPHLYNQLHLASARNRAFATAAPPCDRVDCGNSPHGNVSGDSMHISAETTNSQNNETKAITVQCPSLSLEEVELWVWPVVASPHWQAFRKRASRYWRQQRSTEIGRTQPSLGFTDTTAATPLHMHARSSPGSLHLQRIASSGSGPPMTSCQRRAPYLLYGHCSALLPRRTDWPVRAIDTGAWAHRPPPQPPASLPLPSLLPQSPSLPDELLAFLSGGSSGSNHGDSKVVYVNLGAAWTSLPLPVHLSFARALLSACGSIGRRVLVHLPRRDSVPHDPSIENTIDTSVSQDQGSRESDGESADEKDVGTLLEDAFTMAEQELVQRYSRWEADVDVGNGSEGNSGEAEQRQRLLLWRRGPISPSLLYAAHCCGVVHHGGSGSVLSAATSGLPQLPLPFFFDQPLWACRVAALGLDGSPVATSWSSQSVRGNGSGLDENHNVDGCDQSALVAALESLVATGHQVGTQREFTRENGGDEEPLKRDMAEAEANFTAALTSALAQCLSPLTRLRAACFGKRLRDELWPDEESLMTMKALKATVTTAADDVETSSLSNAAVADVAAVLKDTAPDTAAAKSAMESSLFATAATYGFSRGVAVAVSHLERIQEQEKTSDHDTTAPLGAAAGVAFADNAINFCSNGVSDKEEGDDEKNDAFQDEHIDDEGEEHDELELPNNLWVESISHEETAFLYQEIFVDEEYDWPPAATGSKNDPVAAAFTSESASDAPANATLGFVSTFMANVRPEDVVFDVGANTGLFAIWLLERALAHALATVATKVYCNPTTHRADAETDTAKSAALTTAAQSPVDAPFRLVCVEPAPLTAATLRRNLNRFAHPTSTWVVQAAIVGSGPFSSSCSSSSSSSNGDSECAVESDIIKDRGGSSNTTELCFLPHLPGNSHLAAYESEREAQEAAVLGPSPVTPDRLALLNRLFSGRQRVTVNTCTLCDLVRDALHLPPQEDNSKSGSTESSNDGMQAGGPRIALLKVDVEGAELDVLSSLSAPLWLLVDRVVAEVHDHDLHSAGVASQNNACERDHERLTDAAVARMDETSDNDKDNNDGSSGDGRRSGTRSACGGAYAGGKWRVGGRVAAVDALLRHTAGFAHVTWARPGLCRDQQRDESPSSEAYERDGNDGSASSSLNNWMVYAAREPFEKNL